MSEVIRQDRQPPGREARSQAEGGAATPAPGSYREQFRKEVEALIEDLALDTLQKRYLRSRWLDQVLWMESRAERTRKSYYTLQLVTIIGGVAIPPMVSIDNGSSWANAAHWLAIGLGLTVAVSAAVEGFFHFGDRWKQYRRDAELLKAEGWQFSQRSGPYQDAATHADAYPAFVSRVEQILQKDVEAYFTQVVRSKKEEKPEAPAS